MGQEPPQQIQVPPEFLPQPTGEYWMYDVIDSMEVVVNEDGTQSTKHVKLVRLRIFGHHGHCEHFMSPDAGDSIANHIKENVQQARTNLQIVQEVPRIDLLDPRGNNGPRQ